MAAVFPDETTIYICANNTNGSAAASSDSVVGEIRNFKFSGMEQENDLKNVFGGQIEIDKPRTKGEISFDVSVANTAASTLDRWDNLKFPNGKSSDSVVAHSVWIKHVTGSFCKIAGFNNAKLEVGETEMNADEELMKSVTLRFTAVTPTGSANYMSSTISGSAITGSFFNW